MSTDRREFLFGLGATLGTVALNALLRGDEPSDSALAVKPPHFPAKAKACIFLTMAGGPSHLDTFDPKPKLDQLHLKEFQRQDRFASMMAAGRRYYVKSPFQFRKVGQSGLELCEHFEHLTGVADELCVYKGAVAEPIDHPTALYHLNTGNRFGGDPAMGAWVCYGLGCFSQNLRGYVVLPQAKYPQRGAASWSNGFLPAHFQGTPLRAAGAPILDFTPPPGVTADQQRANLDLLAEFNKAHQALHPRHRELTARTDAYELAFRMQ